MPVKIGEGYVWGHVKGGKPVHRHLSAEQPELLRQAIDNYRHTQQLLRDWDAQTDQHIDAELPLMVDAVILI